MTPQPQQLLSRFQAADLSDRGEDLLYSNLGFPDDPVIVITYTISKWAISCLGPVFWICLGYLLLVAELGK